MKSKYPEKILHCVTLCLAFLALLLSAAACGRGEEGRQTGEEMEEGTIAVAKFHYIELDSPLNVGYRQYAINGDWFYIMDFQRFMVVGTGDEDRTRYIYVSRNRISDGYQEQNYIVRERKDGEGFPQVFLADAGGNCYLFWEPRQDEAGESIYALEKYGEDGTLLWHVEYMEDELLGIGHSLNQGIVTQDGKVLLYSYGTGGRVFAFEEDGNLGSVYDPKLDILEGIASGKGGKVYGYRISGEKALFAELGSGEIYTCPMTPLAVYDGYDDSLCLRIGEGMWSYNPETGTTERLWDWDSAYIQISGDNVDEVFCGDGEFMLLCKEKSLKEQFLTFASVAFEDSREYTEKQTITLTTGFASDGIRLMVAYYNRQSKKYKVEIVVEESASDLEMQLVQGNGSDLLDLSYLYSGNLAQQGAFEDLAPYYEASGIVKGEEILESVRRACTIRGKEVGVIPSFSIQSYMSKEIVSMEEWTVWKFLEMGQERRLLEYQTPEEVFLRCMGIHFGEHFIDWEKRECHFDSEEFRRMLELCSTLERYDDSPILDGRYENLMEGDWLLGLGSILSVWDIVSDQDETFSKKLPGFPGWDGGEYELSGSHMFAINSASEHKEGAWDFLEYLLSEEYQNMVDDAFPVRKSSFDAKLNDLQVSSSRLELSWFLGEPAIPTEEEIALLRRMVDAAVYNDFGGNGTNNPIWFILSEEVGMYFAGDATLDATVQKIQNRVQTYLDEGGD